VSTLVRPDGSGAYPTIQEAVDAAADGDVIELSDGLFKGPGNRDIDFLGKAITIRSQSGKPALCVIDCQGKPNDPHRGFIFRNQEGPDSILEGIGITNGHVANNDEEFGLGGGILCIYTSGPTLRNLALVGNQATGGGGLGCFARSSPQVIDCLFENNHGTVSGGAVMCTADSSPGFEGSLFRENFANEQGGAVFVSAHSAPLITHSRFKANTADIGGAVSGEGFTVNSCKFLDNQAYDHGGAVAARGSTFISNCIMSGNVAENEGGAVHFTGKNFMGNSTLVGNRAFKQGSGIYSSSVSLVKITQTIVAFGESQDGVGTHPDALVTIECSNIYGNDGGDWTGHIEGQFAENGNICADPLFCPSNPGGEGFCSLRDDSPCLVSECGPIGAVAAGCCSEVTAVP
jgi:predicted outer membrane repeat protein